MKRLIKKSNSDEWFHLTNDKNFSYNPKYENDIQQMGPGLYIAPLKDLSKWYRALGGRKYAIPIDVSTLNIVHESEMPEYWKMQQELADAGFSVEDIEKYEPTGDTLDHEPFDIAQKIVWSIWKGYNAIKLTDDSDGEQIRILDNATINFGEPEDAHQLILDFNMGRR